MAKDILFTPDEENSIVAAIANAEKNTSGEIRVHIEQSNAADPVKRAGEVFLKLGLQNTAARNGVLFYVNLKKHSFAIVGDEGINTIVPPNFWDGTKDVVISSFKQGLFADGLIKGIALAGEQLKAHFPFADSDVNELPDTISRY